MISSEAGIARSKRTPCGAITTTKQIFRLLVFREIAAAILIDPALLDKARAEIDAMVMRPPATPSPFWRALLKEPVTAIAAILVRDDPAIDHVCETMPAFVALDTATQTRLVERSRAIFAAERQAV